MPRESNRWQDQDDAWSRCALASAPATLIQQRHTQVAPLVFALCVLDNQRKSAMSLKITVGPPQLALHQGNTVLITDRDGQVPYPGDKGLYFFDTAT